MISHIRKYIMDNAILPTISQQVETIFDRAVFFGKVHVVSKVATPCYMHSPQGESREFFMVNCEELKIPILSSVLQLLTAHGNVHEVGSIVFSRTNAIQVTRSLVPVRKGKDRKAIFTIDRSRKQELSAGSYCIVRYGTGLIVLPRYVLGTTAEHLDHSNNNHYFMIYLIGVEEEDLVRHMHDFITSKSVVKVDRVYYNRFHVVEHVASIDEHLSPMPAPRTSTSYKGLRGGLVEDGVQPAIEPHWSSPHTSRSGEYMFSSRLAMDYALSKGASIIGIDPEDIHFPSINESGFKGAYYSQEIMGIVEDIRLLLSKSDWYSSKGVAINMGILLHGPAGTGKSTLASCIGKEFGIPVHLIYLSGQTDSSFIRAWDEANKNIGCPKVILIEDIDNIFNKREPIHETCQLSFDTLLNKISGVSSMENVILIVTTNRIEYVDEAIGQETVTATGEKTVTRPGRIERIVHLGPMDEECRRGLISSILDEEYAYDVESLVSRSEGMTCAQTKDLCTKYCTQKLKEDLQKSK